MICYGVSAELSEFADEFFPPPTLSPAIALKPKLERNPFDALKDAEHLSNKTIRAEFVRAPILIPPWSCYSRQLRYVRQQPSIHMIWLQDSRYWSAKNG